MGRRATGATGEDAAGFWWYYITLLADLVQTRHACDHSFNGVY
jgi:hypothetical protein